MRFVVMPFANKLEHVKLGKVANYLSEIYLLRSTFLFHFLMKTVSPFEKYQQYVMNHKVTSTQLLSGFHNEMCHKTFNENNDVTSMASLFLIFDIFVKSSIRAIVMFLNYGDKCIATSWFSASYHSHDDSHSL